MGGQHLDLVVLLAVSIVATGLCNPAPQNSKPTTSASGSTSQVSSSLNTGINLSRKISGGTLNRPTNKGTHLQPNRNSLPKISVSGSRNPQTEILNPGLGMGKKPSLTGSQQTPPLKNNLPNSNSGTTDGSLPDAPDTSTDNTEDGSVTTALPGMMDDNTTDDTTGSDVTPLPGDDMSTTPESADNSLPTDGTTDPGAPVTGQNPPVNNPNPIPGTNPTPNIPYSGQSPNSYQTPAYIVAYNPSIGTYYYYFYSLPPTTQSGGYYNAPAITYQNSYQGYNGQGYNSQGYENQG